MDAASEPTGKYLRRVPEVDHQTQPPLCHKSAEDHQPTPLSAPRCHSGNVRKYVSPKKAYWQQTFRKGLESCLRDCMRQGCRIQAYREVFTACPGGRSPNPTAAVPYERGNHTTAPTHTYS